MPETACITSSSSLPPSISHVCLIHPSCSLVQLVQLEAHKCGHVQYMWCDIKYLLLILLKMKYHFKKLQGPPAKVYKNKTKPKKKKTL